MKKMKRFPFVPTLLVVVAITYLSLDEQPVGDSIRLFEGGDKLVHGCMYLGLVGVGCFDCYRMQERRVLWSWFLVMSGAMAMGGAMELLQKALTTERSADAIDFVANCSGAVAGVLLAWWVVPWMFHRLGKRG